MSQLLSVAEKFYNTISKFSAREKINRNRLTKMLGNGRKSFSEQKKNLDILEAKDVKLKSELDRTRAEFERSRKALKQLQDSLDTLDVANADDVTLYDGDIGYHIRGKEYHAERTPEGGITLVPMRSYRKKLKGEQSPPNVEVQEENLESEFDEPEEDSNDAWDEKELSNFWWSE